MKSSIWLSDHIPPLSSSDLVSQLSSVPIRLVPDTSPTALQIPKSRYSLYLVFFLVHITYEHLPVYFKSSLDYFKYLIQCKCMGNSCWCRQIQILHVELLHFFPQYFDPQVIESIVWKLWIWGLTVLWQALVLTTSRPYTELYSPVHSSHHPTRSVLWWRHFKEAETEV